MIFGWRLTREPVSPTQEALKKELEKVKKELKQKELKKTNANNIAAVPHLKMIERYKEQLSVSDSLRKAELEAIIAQRVSKVLALGVEYNNNPSELLAKINGY